MKNEDQFPELLKNTRTNPTEFITKCKDLVDWDLISTSQKLTWDLISKYKKLTPEFITENKDLADWFNISKYQNLTPEFITKHKDLVDWNNISKYQKLTPKFITENKDLVEWYCVSIYQKLPLEFITENKDLVKWNCISKYQKLTPELIKEYNLTIPENSWIYKSPKEKEDYIRNNTNYEIRNGKVVAYKTTRSNGYSTYNFQYLYEEGKEYESHADYNSDNENSFGLSAWTKEKAIEFHPDGKLFEVEIAFYDLACVVHNGNKIRASKIFIVKEI